MKKILTTYTIFFYAFCMRQTIHVACDQTINIELATEQSVNTGSGGWIISQVKSGSRLLFPDEIKDPVEIIISTKDFYYNYLIKDLSFKNIVICYPNVLEIHSGNENPNRILFGYGLPSQNLWKPVQ